MNNKAELIKQLIILSIILIIVIIVAIVVNVGKKEEATNIIKEQITNNMNQKETDKEKQILDNLKGLLEEPQTDDYIQEPEEGTKDKITTTNSGETVIIRE